MKSLIVGVLGWVVGLSAVGAAENVFSKTVRPEDFSAAGLAKLSPDELSKLDALVTAFRSGALEAARSNAAAAEAKAARAESEMRAAQEVAAAQAQTIAKEKKADGGLLAKAKVLLTPGTEVEYTTVESRIAGDFKGWEGRAVLTLENGQRWQIANGGLYSTPPVPSPKVKIVPASLGGFWMMIEGLSTRVRVVPFGSN